MCLVTLFQEQVNRFWSRLKVELRTSCSSRWLTFLARILWLDCFIFPRFLLICHMRITQSNKRLAWFLDSQNRSRNRVFRVFLNWNSKKSLTFSLFNLDQPCRYFSEKTFIGGQSKLANFQHCIFCGNIFEKLFQNKKNDFTIFRSEQQFWFVAEILTKNFYVVKRKISTCFLSLWLKKFDYAIFRKSVCLDFLNKMAWLKFWRKIRAVHLSFVADFCWGKFWDLWEKTQST